MKYLKLNLDIDGKLAEFEVDNFQFFYKEDKQYIRIYENFILKASYLLHRLDKPTLVYHYGLNKYCINGIVYDSKEDFEIALYLYKNNLENYK